jgi:hypothetical protein
MTANQFISTKWKKTEYDYTVTVPARNIHNEERLQRAELHTVSTARPGIATHNLSHVCPVQ